MHFMLKGIWVNILIKHTTGQYCRYTEVLDFEGKKSLSNTCYYLLHNFTSKCWI